MIGLILGLVLLLAGIALNGYGVFAWNDRLDSIGLWVWMIGLAVTVVSLYLVVLL